jgi:selenocysteine lyase/cysteine desulfurase
LRDRSASGHIVSLRHPTAAAEQVQARLAEEHRIITSSRGGGIRVSLHAYNCAEDVRALAQALESAGRDGRPRRQAPGSAPARGRHAPGQVPQ